MNELISIVLLVISLLTVYCLERVSSRWLANKILSGIFGTVSGIAAVGLFVLAFAARGVADESPAPPSTPAVEVESLDLGDGELRAKMREVAAARPSWVGQSPVRDGEVHSIVVGSGPYVTAAESSRALDEALVAATADYIREFLGNDYAPTVLRYNIDSISRDLVGPEHRYDESQWFSVGEMRQSYAMLKFDRQFREQLSQRWRSVIAGSRLAQTGLGLGAVLGFLGLIFGYLRADTATRGYYTKRLQFATAITILALLGVGLFMTKWILWL